MNNYDEEKNKKRPILINDSERTPNTKSNIKRFRDGAKIMAQEHLIDLPEESILESARE